MEDSKEAMQALINELVAKDTKSSEKGLAFEKEALEKVFLQGKSLKEAMGFSDNLVEYLYEQGYRNYQSGNYDKAIAYFYLLMQLNSKDKRFLEGYAACQYKQERYYEAINSYTLLSIIDPRNPAPHYFQGLIFQKLNDSKGALLSFQAVVALCEGIPELSPMRERATLYIAGIEGQSKNKGEGEKKE